MQPRSLYALLIPWALGCSGSGSKAFPSDRPPAVSYSTPSWPQLRAQVDSALVSIEHSPSDQPLESRRRYAERVNALLETFQAEMVSENMSCDAQLVALTDTVQRDLGTLPTMTGAELHQAFPAQTRRLRRLIDAQRMMRSGM